MLAFLRALDPKVWLVVALLAGAIFYTIWVFSLGSKHTEDKINEENHESLSGADNGELRFKSCPTGWLYDFGTQNCFNPKASGRH